MASTSEEPENREQTPVNQEQTAEVQERMYKTKVIQFLGRNTPIILQNDNGPCALIAICNVLLLRNNLGLSTDVTEVSQGRLLRLVAEQLIASSSNNKDAASVENQPQHVADAIDLLPSFASGINVDIKFNRINDFEVTRESAIFDVLHIPLYHGWIVNPQDSDTANAIGSKSFNILTEELVALHTRSMDALKITETVDSGSRIIPCYNRLTFETNNSGHVAKLKSSESGKHVSEIEMVPLVKKTEDPDGDNRGSTIRFNDDWVSFETDPGKDVDSSLETEKASHMVQESLKDKTDGITAIQGELIRNFLKNSAGQLTPYGLFRLNWDLNECELCVFFRNNHFNTMFKIGNALYILVTDQGYLYTPGVVWEKLHEVNGDTLFANSNFKIFKPAICEIEEVSDDENMNLATVMEFLADTEKTAAQENKSLSSDMQFLKDLELQQQSQCDQPATFPSGFIVGPKQNYSPWPRPQSEFSKKDSPRKMVKEKCNLM